MKETIQKMDHELERYHKNNANLDLTIADLRDKLMGSAEGRHEAAQDHLLSRRRDSELPERPPRDVASDSEPQAARGVGEEPVPETRHDRGGGQDPGRGYPARVRAQAEFLEKSIASLKRKLHKDMETHRSDNMRIMNENVSLLKEINELRREMKLARQRERAAVPGELSRRSVPRRRFRRLPRGKPGLCAKLKPQSSGHRPQRGRRARD